MEARVNKPKVQNLSREYDSRPARQEIKWVLLILNVYYLVHTWAGELSKYSE